jgi:Uri superfamily endonuclease
VLATRGHNTSGPFEVPGTYVVFFRLAAARRVRIGALGTFDFPAGVYGYVVGAFGAGDVRKRTHRHLTRHSKNKTWNIDHLKPHCTPVEVWWTHDRNKVEFDWAAVLAALPGASIPARGFGSNDNPTAEAHLVHFADLPTFAEFERRVRRRLVGHARLCQVTIERWCGSGWPLAADNESPETTPTKTGRGGAQPPPTSPSSSSNSDGVVRSARAIFRRLNSATLRSPRSTLPMKVRCRPHASASAA